MSSPVIVVGAGLAGLVCARRLSRAGRSVLILDADTRVGGRLKTDVVDGFRLDRGFQVFFSAYPHAAQELDLEALHLAKFDSGAHVWTGMKMESVGKDDIVHMAFSPFIPFGDKMRVPSLGQELKGLSFEQIWSAVDIRAEVWLRNRGFSEAFLDRFARPFFGGIFLDRSLSVSSRMASFVWKMLDAGATGVPAEGMEAIPRQLAADIPVEAFRFGVRVDSLVHDQDGITGVRLENGEEIEATTVVVATDAPEASRLAGAGIPHEGKSSCTVWFDAPASIGTGPRLVLNGPSYGRINHVVDMTAAAPSYSPPGRHLIGACLLETAERDDEDMAFMVQKELGAWFPQVDVSAWRLLRVDRLNFAQMNQPPGFQADLPRAATDTHGLFLAGEYTTYSSIDGAIKSGQEAAAAILGNASL